MVFFVCWVCHIIFHNFGTCERSIRILAVRGGFPHQVAHACAIRTEILTTSMYTVYMYVHVWIYLHTHTYTHTHIYNLYLVEVETMTQGLSQSECCCANNTYIHTHTHIVCVHFSDEELSCLVVRNYRFEDPKQRNPMVPQRLSTRCRAKP